MRFAGFLRGARVAVSEMRDARVRVYVGVGDDAAIDGVVDGVVNVRAPSRGFRMLLILVLVCERACVCVSSGVDDGM